MLDQTLKQGTVEFVNWFKEYALPLWSTQGIDPSVGASYERFLINGEVDKEVKPRVRVQARQIFTFCKAQELGWMPDASGVVDGLVSFAKKYGAHPSGQGYGHLLSPQYELVESHLDLYNHAFWILASAARYKTFKDAAAVEQANDIIHMLDANFGSVSGGWLEGDYDAPCRRQNPHMHLFEASMAMYEATGDAPWLARAGELFCLFETRFFDPKYGVLREFFDNDWQILEDAKGDIIEPGHMMEWVWLLRWYERLSGHDVSVYANAMYDTGLTIGKTESGLMYDEVSPEGNVLANGTKRCWPIIEMIKASIVQARAGASEGAEELAGASLRLLLDQYLTHETKGLYIDRRDGDDAVISDVAPASTLYHLIVAAEEVDKYVTEKEA